MEHGGARGGEQPEITTTALAREGKYAQNYNIKWKIYTHTHRFYIRIIALCEKDFFPFE